MKKTIYAIALLLLFAGCADKTRVLQIENRGLCSAPIAQISPGTFEVKNSAKTFNIPPHDIQSALVKALRETNCFVVSEEPLRGKNIYLLDTIVMLSQEREITEKNIFKKEERELLKMEISLHAHNKNASIKANANSELLVDKPKILGITAQKNGEENKKILLDNGVKKASVALKHGFDKLH